MQKSKIFLVGFIGIMILITSFSGCIESEPTKQIEATANIPYHSDGGILESGTGSAGILYCKGKVVETEGVIEYIELDWMADVTFPGNCERGYLFWSEMWFDTPTCPFGTCDPNTAIPSPDYVSPEASWINAKGEHHQWGAEIKIYSNDVHIRLIDDNSVYTELWFSDVAGKHVGYSDIKDGRYAIYSYFETKVEDCSSTTSIDIVTSPFYLVFEGAEVWFE